MQDDHLVTAKHTLEHWPQELYLTSPVVDRENRESWVEKGRAELYPRACDEVERRLVAYEPVETDPKLDAELRRIILAGLASQTTMPETPPPQEPRPASPAPRRDRRRRRRG
jgi:trimethylamine:corrinoid methyltransferase-like protein